LKKKVTSLQPANEEEKRGKGAKKGASENKKIKVCKFKKGSYLCSPKRKGRKNERKPEAAEVRKLRKEGRNSGRESWKTGSDFRDKNRKRRKRFPDHKIEKFITFKK
jgi:hypothetical protein